MNTLAPDSVDWSTIFGVVTSVNPTLSRWRRNPAIEAAAIFHTA